MKPNVKKTHFLLSSCGTLYYRNEQYNSTDTLNSLPIEENHEIENCVTYLDFYTYQDVHGRSIRISTESSDSPQVSSSHISMKHPTSSPVFGQVKSIFEHSCNGVKNTFVNVHWFSNPQIDTESGLIFVCTDCDCSIPNIVPITLISKPLVTAIDSDTPTKLWILTYVDLL